MWVGGYGLMPVLILVAFAAWVRAAGRPGAQALSWTWGERARLSVFSEHLWDIGDTTQVISLDDDDDDDDAAWTPTTGGSPLWTARVGGR